MTASHLELVLDWILRWDQTIGTVGSLILSAGLVWLYSQQKSILDEQRDLAAAEQRSQLRVSEYHIFSWSDLISTIDIERMPESVHYSAALSAEVENIGKGAAFDIESSLYMRSERHTISLTTPLSHSTNIDQMSLNQEGGSLGDGELAHLSAFYQMGSEDLPEEFLNSDISVEDQITPSEILWMFEDLGYYDVEIGILIHYTDATGVRDPKRLITTKVDLREHGDLRQALIHGEYPRIGKESPYTDQIDDLFGLWDDDSGSH